MGRTGLSGMTANTLTSTWPRPSTVGSLSTTSLLADATVTNRPDSDNDGGETKQVRTGTGQADGDVAMEEPAEPELEVGAMHVPAITPVPAHAPATVTAPHADEAAATPTPVITPGPAIDPTAVGPAPTPLAGKVGAVAVPVITPVPAHAPATVTAPHADEPDEIHTTQGRSKRCRGPSAWLQDFEMEEAEETEDSEEAEETEDSEEAEETEDSEEADDTEEAEEACDTEVDDFLVGDCGVDDDHSPQHLPYQRKDNIHEVDPHEVRVVVATFCLSSVKRACKLCIDRPFEWVLWRLVVRKFAKAYLNDHNKDKPDGVCFADHVRATIQEHQQQHKQLSYAVASMHGYTTSTKRFQACGITAELACSALSVHEHAPLKHLSHQIRLHWDGHLKLSQDEMISMHLEYAGVLQRAALEGCELHPTIHFSALLAFRHWPKTIVGFDGATSQSNMEADLGGDNMALGSDKVVPAAAGLCDGDKRTKMMMIVRSYGSMHGIPQSGKARLRGALRFGDIFLNTVDGGSPLLKDAGWTQRDINQLREKCDAENCSRKRNPSGTLCCHCSHNKGMEVQPPRWAAWQNPQCSVPQCQASATTLWAADITGTVARLDVTVCRVCYLKERGNKCTRLSRSQGGPNARRRHVTTMRAGAQTPCATCAAVAPAPKHRGQGLSQRVVPCPPLSLPLARPWYLMQQPRRVVRPSAAAVGNRRRKRLVLANMRSWLIRRRRHILRKSALMRPSLAM